MIFDKLTNIERYGLPAQLQEAVTFVREARERPEGRYEMKDGIFVLIQQYNTQPEQARRLEGHERMADIQCVLQGGEEMGIALMGRETIAYDEAKDIAFYDGESSAFPLREGEFAMIFPGELHKPCVGDGSYVKKAVIKVPYKLFCAASI